MSSCWNCFSIYFAFSDYNSLAFTFLTDSKRSINLLLVLLCLQLNLCSCSDCGAVLLKLSFELLIELGAIPITTNCISNHSKWLNLDLGAIPTSTKNLLFTNVCCKQMKCTDIRCVFLSSCLHILWSNLLIWHLWILMQYGSMDTLIFYLTSTWLGMKDDLLHSHIVFWLTLCQGSWELFRGLCLHLRMWLSFIDCYDDESHVIMPTGIGIHHALVWHWGSTLATAPHLFA